MTLVLAAAELRDLVRDAGEHLVDGVLERAAIAHLGEPLGGDERLGIGAACGAVGAAGPWRCCG